jgi:hypothetical protein
VTYQPQPGDIGLSGVKAQGVVSLAIKLGSVLRHEDYAGWSGLILVAPPVAAVVLAIALGWSLLGAAAAVCAALVAAVALVVIWAALLGFRSRNKTWFSHSFIVHHVDPVTGVWITESHAKGVETRKLHYTPGDFVWLTTSSLLGRDDADEMRAFLDSVTGARWKYDYGTFAGLAIFCICGAMLVPPRVGTAICSGLTSEALTRGRAIWPVPAYRMLPQSQYWWAVKNGVAVVETG